MRPRPPRAGGASPPPAGGAGLALCSPAMLAVPTVFFKLGLSAQQVRALAILYNHELRAGDSVLGMRVSRWSRALGGPARPALRALCAKGVLRWWGEPDRDGSPGLAVMLDRPGLAARAESGRWGRLTAEERSFLSVFRDAREGGYYVWPADNPYTAGG